MNSDPADSLSLTEKRRATLNRLWPALVGLCIIISVGNSFPFARPRGPVGDEATFFWWLNTLVLALLTLYSAVACLVLASLSVRLSRADGARRADVRALIDRLRREGHAVSPALEDYLLRRFDPRDLQRLPVRDWAEFFSGMEEVAAFTHRQSRWSIVRSLSTRG